MRLLVALLALCSAAGAEALALKSGLRATAGAQATVGSASEAFLAAGAGSAPLYLV